MHLAIFSTSLAINSNFIQNLLQGKTQSQLESFANKQGVIMAQYTLDRFIKEEALHDDKTLTRGINRSIQTFSSGEQRKALLNYLLAQNPDFVVLDGAFDMLDIESRKDLKQRLTLLAKEMPIIQIVKRNDNLLPFIKNAIAINGEKVVFFGTVSDYLKQNKAQQQKREIPTLPPPIEALTTEKNPLVQFTNVNIKYSEKDILQNINWTINSGDFWHLKGPNGSGKTTLLSLITGDNPKAYGQNIMLFGHQRGSGESIWDIKKRIGYITPAMTTLFRGWNTVEKMVISGMVDSIGLYKTPSNLQRKLAKKWVECIGLSDKIHHRFSSLSEGEQCMVLIARAMIKHPPLLILDEPSHGLNDENAAVLSQLVNKISEEGNTSIIFVSHRNEPALTPKQVFELVKQSDGSIGRVV
jgi:molybdate transport system ATP-binding protein